MQHRTRTALVVFALPLWAACSVLVDPDALQVRCEIEVPDPCLALGQKCIENICQDCDEDERELCNGRDDDCDGKIDEGHDEDKDGFTWCGGGMVEMADCVDSDAKVHPLSSYEYGAQAEAPAEGCDGKDNDCDSKVDEGNSCAAMKKCIDDSGCPDDKRCDVGSGVCFIPREVGSACTNDSDCKGGFCLHPDEFKLPVKLTDNRCATACCSNADCEDKESTCLIADSGARVCLPKTIVGSGSRKPGEGCSLDAQCASGLCLRNACQTPCLNAEACPNNECVLSPASPTEPRVFVCAGVSASARLLAGDFCGLPLTACRTGFCYEDFCRRSCARNRDCGSNGVCEFVEAPQVLGRPPSQVSVCESRANVDAEGIEQLCCTDADCSTNQLCAPNMIDRETWHMSCRGKE